MPIYATAADLASYVADNTEVGVPTGVAADRLLERAERDVDRVVGPWPVFSNGRKFDPPSLTAPQRAALSRATCAAAEFRLTIGESELVGDDDYLPALLTPLRTAGRTSPKMLEELAGSGLVKWSGMPPEPVVVVS